MPLHLHVVCRCYTGACLAKKGRKGRICGTSALAAHLPLCRDESIIGLVQAASKQGARWQNRCLASGLEHPPPSPMLSARKPSSSITNIFKCRSIISSSIFTRGHIFLSYIWKIRIRIGNKVTTSSSSRSKVQSTQCQWVIKPASSVSTFITAIQPTTIQEQAQSKRQWVTKYHGVVVPRTHRTLSSICCRTIGAPISYVSSSIFLAFVTPLERKQVDDVWLSDDALMHPTFTPCSLIKPNNPENNEKINDTKSEIGW